MRFVQGPAGSFSVLRSKLAKKCDALWTEGRVATALSNMGQDVVPRSFDEFLDLVLNWAWTHGRAGPRGA